MAATQIPPPVNPPADSVIFRLTLEMRPEDLEPSAAKVVELLQQLTGDASLRLKRAEPASASLVLEGTRAALVALGSAQKKGGLEPLLARRVSALAIEGSPVALCQVLEAELSRVDLKDTVQAEEWRRSASVAPLEPAEEATRQQEVYQAVHARGRRAALCLSGGGIRSATFSLGVLQGLAGQGWLPRFDFLSTVSGGGYIGGWFTAWLHRSGGKLEVLEAELARQCPRSIQESEPEAPAIRHLRAFSNYLSPRMGLLSPDIWTLAAIYLRNLLINLSVLLPWLCAALMMPRLCLVLISGEAWKSGDYYGPLVLVVSAGLALVGAMLAVNEVYSRSDPDLEARALLPDQERFLLWLGMAAVGITVYLPWYTFVSGQPLFLGAILITLVLLVASSLGHYLWYGRVLMRRMYTGARSGGRAGAGAAGMSGGVAGVGAGGLAGGAACGVAGVGEVARAGAGGQTAGVAGTANTEARSASFLGRLRDVLAAWVSWVPLQLTISVAGAIAVAALWALQGLKADPLFLLTYVCLAPPFLLFALFLGMAAASLAWSTWLEPVDLEWAARRGAWVLLLAVTSLVVNGTILYGPELLVRAVKGGASALVAAGGISGALVWAARQVLASRSAQGSSDEKGSGLLIGIGTVVAAPFFTMLILTTLSLGLTWLIAEPGQDWLELLAGRSSAKASRVISIFAGVVLTGVVASLLARVNKFSLHSMYRDRLVRAYLGASHEHRDRHSGTFDYDDDLRLGELAELRPFHVVNATLNVMQRSECAWQQSKSEPFTFSRLHCGSSYLVDPGSSLQAGYREAAGYGNGVTLGTAISISGAAASPNMGDYSSAPFAFLMSLFNLRMGAWMGNPCFPNRRWIDRKLAARIPPAWRRTGPALGAYYLLRETLCRADEYSKFLYLSDGGHFENLGLYEMVLRRCQLILVVDAGCDPKRSFGDLGNAVRKIRIKLGIAIEFDRLEQLETGGYAEATIDYSAVDGTGARAGRLIYLKPGLLGDEPVDVRNYARQVSAFPHETTADQFFSEAQFESYRALGRATAARLPADLLESCDAERVAQAE